MTHAKDWERDINHHLAEEGMDIRFHIQEHKRAVDVMRQQANQVVNMENW